MARPPSSLLTDREAAIMDVLWTRGQATADEIRAALPDEPHDSSVRTLLRILQRKRYLKIRKQKPYLYVPAIERDRVQQDAAKNLLARFFGGSAESLVLRLLENESLTPEQLDELARKYDFRKSEASHDE
jgi:BlaI family penicillinase repressor